MKLQSIFKIITIICFGLLLSCSSDSGNSSGSLVLMKRVTTVGEESDDVQLVYESNVLNKLVRGNSYIEFTYSGSKITFAKSYTNGALVKTNSFIYTGDLLTSITSDGSSQERSILNYVNNKLSSIEYEYLSGAEWQLIEKEDFQFDSNSNVSQYESMFDAGNQFFTTRNENHYDNKNNPMRDLNPYIRLYAAFINIDGKSTNNVISANSFSPADSTTSENYTYQIIYNENDFPTEIKRFSPEGNLLTTTTIQY